MTRVYVAAPTPMMRAGLRAMLTSGDIEVVGESASLGEVRIPSSGLDVLVVADPDLPEQAVRSVVGEGTMSVIALADDDRFAASLRTLPLRGWGIVPTDAPSAELQAAVQAASQGLVVLPLATGQRLLSQVSTTPVSLDSDTLQEPLTAREQEVLQLLSQGLSNKLIARRLNISEHTVKFHVSSIYTKLGASSRTDAVNRGARNGLIAF